MKIKFTSLIVIVLAVTLCFGLFGCGKEFDMSTLETSWEVPDYESGEVVADMSAFDLYIDAVENYYNEDYIWYGRSFSFEAGGGILATQQSVEITKYNNGNIFNQIVKDGTKLGKEDLGRRYYYDASDNKTYQAESKDDKTNFATIADANWAGLSDYAEKDTGDDATASANDKMAFTSYVITSRDNLSSSHNDTVYKIGDKYYICMTIKCMEIEEGTVQATVEQEIEDGLGSTVEAGSFLWLADTIIIIEIEEVDGVMLPTAKNMEESYEAKQAAMVSSHQITSGKYTYSEEAAEITDEELNNLD